MKPRTILIISCVLVVVGVTCLIAGIALLAMKSDKCDPEEREVDVTVKRCNYSQEAQRVGIDAFLKKVQDKYFELHPYEVYRKPGVKPSEIREKYKSYDPTPANLKYITDEASTLYTEVSDMDISTSKLNRRERKALAQVKHFLKHNFATPFDGNYYGGDFLLGPNNFCYQAICRVGDALGKNLEFFKPHSLNDVETLKGKLVEVNATFSRYIANLRYGVKAGMVRSVEQCRAGLDAVKASYSGISHSGAKGVFYEYFMKDFLSVEFLLNITAAQRDQWKKDNKGKAFDQSISEYALEYVGKPIHDFISFLETEQMQHCVPSNVSSGLATLPLSHVYTNGTADLNQTTTKRLPTGEPLNGTQAYLKMLSFFTTTDDTPDEVHKLGNEMLSKLYPEALEVAKNVTGKQDVNETIEEFVKKLNSSKQYFNDGEIPGNESDGNAHQKCSTTKNAKKNCPKRMEAMDKWISEARKVMSMLSPKTVNMFYFTGANQTTPSCPLEIAINFNPSMGVPSYRGSNKDCTRNAKYYVPFFLDRLGPRYMQWSTNAHEGAPGHHTQVQGLTEHFQDACGGLIGWLSGSTFYTAFGEGWALYAENPLIAHDTDVYKEEPLYKYGMLKSQIWRALRMIVDTGLHSKGLTRRDAIQLFREKLWDDGDVTQKEVTRYQSVPGQATSYMIGQLHILKLREYAQKELGDAFRLKEFHLQLLHQGSAPLSYIQGGIEEYVKCAKDKEKDGCDEVLNPLDGKAAHSEIDEVEEQAPLFYF